MEKWTVQSTKILTIGLVMLSLLFFGSITYYSIARLSRVKPTELVVTGKRVWKQKSCAGCHTLLGNGSANLASDLTHAVSESSLEDVRSFLLRNRQREEEGDSRHPVLNIEEVEAILHLLQYVDQIPDRDINSFDFANPPD